MSKLYDIYTDVDIQFKIDKKTKMHSIRHWEQIKNQMDANKIIENGLKDNKNKYIVNRNAWVDHLKYLNKLNKERNQL